MTGPLDPTQRPWFFCGIGGSGMLPLAQIVHGLGGTVAGSDRSRDQGRSADKFAWLESHGFALFSQDGSGVTSAEQIVVASAAVEETVPEIVKATALGCQRMTRAELNAALFNGAEAGIGIAGTSGKSTVTAMLGWILHRTGRTPTIMNGAVMKNFVTADEPLASAKVGGREFYVSEVDESDGSIALYRPAVGVLLNVSLDHKSMNELHVLFGDYLRESDVAVVNADDPDARALAEGHPRKTSFSLSHEVEADIWVDPVTILEDATGTMATVFDSRLDRSGYVLRLSMPGIHNLSNALAAIAGASGAGVPVSEAVAALESFEGLARRFDIVGSTASGITVIDDFGHNPEKCAATIRTLKRHPGRVIAYFQPHGYGPLRQMGQQLAETFARELGPDDVTILSDPVYFGGTADRTEGADRVVRLINEAGGRAEHIAARDDVSDRIVDIAKPGDRVVVMGARDDTLTEFAKALLARLP